MPVIITIGIANNVGAYFTRGLYDRAVRAKQIPILKKEAPMANRHLRAENIMATPILTMRTVETVKKIYEALKSPHHGFPVLNLNGQVIGLIPKNYLFILIKKKAFYSHPD